MKKVIVITTELLQAAVLTFRSSSPMSKPLVLLRTLGAIGVLAVAGLLAMSAQAITNGQLDGNRHPNVGALLFDWDPTHPGLDVACSGTLIAPTVFLTAAHCDPDPSLANAEVWVSFDPDVYAPETVLYHGTFVPDPEFTWKHVLGTDTHDIAVVLLDTAPTGNTPARLPQAGLLDLLKAAGILNGLKFTAVGYGIPAVTFGGGRPTASPIDGARRYAVSDFLGLSPVWLTLLQNPQTGNGGSCAGDSGGPHFLGAGSSETDIVVATTVTGGGICNATSDTYRLDTDSARSFLGNYVTLP
jgi:hypothetical protein